MPVIVYTRLEGSGEDWQELERGPGYFTLPDGHEARVRIKGIDDADLLRLVEQLREVQALRFLDLSENRNVTDAGLARLRGLPQLTGLNLSSCSITNPGLKHLEGLPRLAHLNLSYCNRLNDASLKILEGMHQLTYVNLLGCLSITRAAISRVRRSSLEIYR
jgi:hypothetical protein